MTVFEDGKRRKFVDDELSMTKNEIVLKRTLSDYLLLK